MKAKVTPGSVKWVRERDAPVKWNQVLLLQEDHRKSWRKLLSKIPGFSLMPNNYDESILVAGCHALIWLQAEHTVGTKVCGLASQCHTQANKEMGSPTPGCSRLSLCLRLTNPRVTWASLQLLYWPLRKAVSTHCFIAISWALTQNVCFTLMSQR